MGKPPFGSEACCLPAADGISYIRIGDRQIVIGMRNLDVIFEQLWLLNRTPEQVSEDELIGMARKFNYISRTPSTEKDYAEALGRAYRTYYERRAAQSKPE